MSDRTDDQYPDEPLLPSLMRGATVRLPVSRKDPAKDPRENSLAPRTPRPQGAEKGDASAAGEAARAEGTPDAEHDDPDSNPIIDSELAERPRGARSGDVIGGRYLVEGQIGRGGMGRVLQVRHQVLGKAFALKLIKAPIAANRRIREMFYQEAKLASSLSHENICSIVDFGADAHFGLFMVMELLEGQSLFHRLYYKGRLAPKVACDVIWQVAEALRYIHGQGIVHGDIKSENILLIRTPEQRRVVKLLDFGLARASLDGPVGGIEGTPEYLAPERIRGGAASTASDIYALGVLFYELLVGQLPFTGSMEEVFRLHLSQPIPMASERLDAALDERADEIIARATSKDPSSRHADVAGFMYELRTLMNMLGMALPGRLRSGAVESRSGRPRGRTNLQPRIKDAAELFEHAPVPLASLDREGRVQVANQAFCKFVGVDGDGAGVSMCESVLADVYPELPEDLHAVATLRATVKRVLHLETPEDVPRDSHASSPAGAIVEVAVILAPAPKKTSSTAGEVHITLHPLNRHEKR